MRVQRAALMAREQERRFDAREKRLAMIDTLLRAAVDVIVLADLPHVEPEAARELVPVVRLLARDMLQAEQRELGLAPVQPGTAGGQVAPFTSDEMAAAVKAVEEFESALHRGAGVDGADCGEAAGALGGAPAATSAPESFNLLVVVGADPQLRVDLAALRKVKQQTGLNFHRLTEATAEALDSYMRRERKSGRPVRLMHMAVHASADGVALADRTVDGNWLSERLLGVQVLVLAGCKGDGVGDWLGVVPHVITLSEDISHGDAATLTEQFWLHVAKGRTPSDALTLALERCAPAVSEYVVKHW